MTARVILHLPERAQQNFRRMKIHGIQAAIDRLISQRGGKVLITTRDDALYGAMPLPGDGDLHIVENGCAQGPGYLNAAAAYLEGFFHLDPKGVLADASSGGMRFDPAAVDPGLAQDFYASLQRRFSQARHSRYGQMKPVSQVPDGAIAVFLQGPKPERRGQAHMSTLAMLRAVVQGAGGRPVVVKLHPITPDFGRKRLDRARDEGLEFTETQANVHDILAAASVSVSINSACGFEGFLHGTPAIFCGRTDFHHAVETLRQPQDFPAALHSALTTRRDYAKAMYWYFGQLTFALDDPDLDAKLLARFAAQGFSADRLGLNG